MIHNNRTSRAASPLPLASQTRPDVVTQSPHGVEEYAFNAPEASPFERRIDALVDRAKTGADISMITRKLLSEIKQLSITERLRLLDHLVVRLAMFVPREGQPFPWTSRDVVALLDIDIRQALPEFFHELQKVGGDSVFLLRPEDVGPDKWTAAISKTVDDLVAANAPLTPGASDDGHRFVSGHFVHEVEAAKFCWLQGRTGGLVQSLKDGVEGADIMQAARALRMDAESLGFPLSLQALSDAFDALIDPELSNGVPTQSRKVIDNLLGNVIQPWFQDLYIPDGFDRERVGEATDAALARIAARLQRSTAMADASACVATQRRLDEMPNVLLAQIAAFATVAGDSQLGLVSTQIANTTAAASGKVRHIESVVIAFRASLRRFEEAEIEMRAMHEAQGHTQPGTREAHQLGIEMQNSNRLFSQVRRDCAAAARTLGTIVVRIPDVIPREAVEMAAALDAYGTDVNTRSVPDEMSLIRYGERLADWASRAAS